MSSERLLVKQCLSGVDVAVDDPAAAQMVNCSYLVADRVAGVALVVDPAWGPADLLEIARSMGLQVIGVLATHGHADHVGGAFYGRKIPGIRELVQAAAVPVHAHRGDVPMILRSTGLSAAHVVAHDDGDEVPLGDLRVRLLHTPGHTPGSCCWWVEDALLTGDTVFCMECGRVDLPGSSPAEMIRTLTERLAALPGSLTVWPGHDYGGRSGLLSDLRRTNPVLAERDPSALWSLVV